MLQSNPDEHLLAILADAAGVAAAESDAEIMRSLRRLKAEAALLIGLADIGGVWPVMRVTTALTATTLLSARSSVTRQNWLSAASLGPPTSIAPSLFC